MLQQFEYGRLTLGLMIFLYSQNLEREHIGKLRYEQKVSTHVLHSFSTTDQAFSTIQSSTAFFPQSPSLYV